LIGSIKLKRKGFQLLGWNLIINVIHIYIISNLQTLVLGWNTIIGNEFFHKKKEAPFHVKYLDEIDYNQLLLKIIVFSMSTHKKSIQKNK